MRIWRGRLEGRACREILTYKSNTNHLCVVIVSCLKIENKIVLFFKLHFLFGTHFCDALKYLQQITEEVRTLPIEKYSAASLINFRSSRTI